jgi:hypothetical protein
MFNRVFRRLLAPRAWALALGVALFGATIAPAAACFPVQGNSDGTCTEYLLLCSYHADGTGGLYIAHRVTVCWV